MSNEPYSVLGIPFGADVEAAKVAYRKLAMLHHPDRGGDEVMFKRIKAAFEAIEAGWTPPKQSAQQAPQQARKRAAPRAPALPKTTKYRNTVYVVLEVTPEQEATGCTIPFNHDGRVLQFSVHPAMIPRDTLQYFRVHNFREDLVIGIENNDLLISVTLKFTVPPTHTFKEASALDEDPPSDMKCKLPVCALGLFTGGKLTTLDHMNEEVQISLPAGYNPAEPIVVKGRGYGGPRGRGDLYVQIEPVFSVPSALSANDLKQLQRLNEMVNT